MTNRCTGYRGPVPQPVCEARGFTSNFMDIEMACANMDSRALQCTGRMGQSGYFANHGGRAVMPARRRGLKKDATEAAA